MKRFLIILILSLIFQSRVFPKNEKNNKQIENRQAENNRRRLREMAEELQRHREQERVDDEDAQRCLPVNGTQIATIVGGLVTLAIAVLQIMQLFTK